MRPLRSPKWKALPWMISGLALFSHASWELVMHQWVVTPVPVALESPYIASDTFISRHDFTYWMEVDNNGSAPIPLSTITYRVTEDGMPVRVFATGRRHRPNAARFEGEHGKTYRVEAHISTLSTEQLSSKPYLRTEVDWSDVETFQLFYNFLKYAGVFLAGVGIVQLTALRKQKKGI